MSVQDFAAAMCLSRIGGALDGVEQSYGIRSASSVCFAIGGRSSAVGACALTADKRRERADAGGAGRFEPAEPAAQERFVDAGDRAEAAAGVAVHRGVADGRLASDCWSTAAARLRMFASIQTPGERTRAWMFCSAMSSVCQVERAAEGLASTMPM